MLYHLFEAGCLVTTIAAKLQADAVRSAAKHVGSYSESEFDIRFNPDIFSPDLNFDQSDEQVEKERAMIRDLAHFLITKQIPLFVSLSLHSYIFIH